MILTQELINKTIKSAKCCLAKKTFTYYAKLALAINDSCLYTQIQHLKRDIRILKHFDIIDEVKECCCTITGEYSFSELSEISPSESQIQFEEDGTGTLVNLSGTYSFTWSFLNNQLFIELSNGNLITYSDVTFNSSCDISFQNQEQGYSFLATIDAPTDAVIYDGAYGVFEVFLPDGTTILENTNYVPSNPSGIPAQEIIPSTLSGSQEIADYWNDQLPTSNLVMTYSSISEVFNMFTAYFNGYDYTDHIFKYTYCIEQPTATITVNPIAMFGGGSLTQSFIVDGTIIYTHNGIYADYAELVAGFNSNVTDYVMTYIGVNDITISTPNAVEGTIFGIDYYNPIYEDDEGEFEVPAFTRLNGTFNPSGLESSSYTNQHPCSTEKVEQTCLSNDDIIKIINNICKQCKTCK